MMMHVIMRVGGGSQVSRECNNTVFYCIVEKSIRVSNLKV